MFEEQSRVRLNVDNLEKPSEDAPGHPDSDTTEERAGTSRK